jgi:hypothetical protein
MSILPRYEDAFAALTQPELAVLLPALGLETTDAQGRPRTGTWLMEHCRAHHISHADVCLSIYGDSSAIAVQCIERLIMRPIDRRTPYEVNISRLERPPGSHRRTPRAEGSRPGTIDPSGVIRVLATTNPKKPGSESHTRFALYRDGQTVSEFLAAGGRKADLSWDLEKGFIAIGEAA